MNRSMKTDNNAYYELYDKSPLSYQSLNDEGRFLDVNPAWCETFGYSREEVLGKKFSDFMTDASGALVPQGFPFLKEQGVVRDAGFEIVHKNGHVVMVMLHGSSSYDENGELLQTHCFLVDVTEKHMAEQKMRKENEENERLNLQFQALLASVADRITLLDRDLRIIWTNQSKSLNEVEFTEHVHGEFCYVALRGQDEPCFECPARMCMEEGRPVQLEKNGPDGKTMLLRTFPVRDHHGEIINVVEIGQDISEKIASQKDLVRTGQLAALGELAAGVAHEINNPITGVINYAQLIKNRSADEAGERKFAEAIIKEGERIAKIVNQLLFLAKDDRSDFIPLDVTGPLSDSLSLVGTQFHKLGIEIQVNLEENISFVKGSAQQLEQLFLNILSNARHALCEKYPESNPNKRIVVSLMDEPCDESPQTVVRFRDFGIGIPEELQGKVFQPFVTSKPSSEGTGLGLSISNDIVKAHGGSITIESLEGQFTEVTIRIPTEAAW